MVLNYVIGIFLLFILGFILFITLGPGTGPSPNQQLTGDTSAVGGGYLPNSVKRDENIPISGYPFAFLNQPYDPMFPWNGIPNTAPITRSCDLEWRAKRAELSLTCSKRADRKTYFGSGIPIATDQTCTYESDGESMFYLKNFRCAPECCPSPYSCDNGCVCIFEKPICTKWPEDLSKDPLRITF